jgi:putative transposase
LPLDNKMLWQEVEQLVERKSGVLEIDDTTLDKPYASRMAPGDELLVGQAGGVDQGINLFSLVWTGNGCRLTCDIRL